MRYDTIRQFVENITIFCPKIQTLSITQYIPELYQKIITNQFQDVQHAFTLNMPGMSFELHPQKLPYVITGNIPYSVVKTVLL